MEFWLGLLGVVVFIVVLVVSVAWHELGHLLPAKLFKVPVSQYMVGFGPTMWSKKVGETEYGVKWILFGGYIRMLGMYTPEQSARAAKKGWRHSMANAAREATRDELAEVTPSAQNRAFYRLSTPRKLVVMLGGPTMNLILALVCIGAAISLVGVYGTSTTVEEVPPCVTASGPGTSSSECPENQVPGPAFTAGVKAGDRLVAWNGEPLETWDQVITAVTAAGPGRSTLTVEREGKRQDLEVEPVTAKGSAGSTKVIGVTSRAELQVHKEPFWKAPALLGEQVAASAQLYARLPVATWETLVDMVKGNE
ncbi:MAG: site-2 protease family protein, partial [Bifidobacteriaceae bacterium]|nr:site-2 protease family protein [Bifidobacteriaceae bacterium]